MSKKVFAARDVTMKVFAAHGVFAARDVTTMVVLPLALLMTVPSHHPVSQVQGPLTHYRLLDPRMSMLPFLPVARVIYQ